MHLVGFFLQMAHVLSLSLLVVETLFVAVEDDVIVLETARNLTSPCSRKPPAAFRGFRSASCLLQRHWQVLR